MRPGRSRGFTLIEVLMAIAISAVITGAVFFTLNSALESWGSSRDMLSLQKVLAESMEHVINGGFEIYGLRHSLELVNGAEQKVEFVPPWTDDTHAVGDKDFIYALNRRIKPGTGLPIGEVKLSESDKWQPVAVDVVDSEDTKRSRVRIGVGAPGGSSVRFVYHPSAKDQSDVVEKIWWDPKTHQIYVKDQNGVESLSQNPFGVEITDFKLRYYGNTSNLVTEHGWLSDEDLMVVTGIEVILTARIGTLTQSLMSFVCLRNAPMRSGRLFLQKDVRIPIPDSAAIHTLLLTNFSGVKSGDELDMEAIPDTGKRWRVKVIFERIGSSRPKIKMVSIEYPPGHTVYTDYPHSDAGAGIDLLKIGPNGLYDYDEDQDVENVVLLKGKVFLKVTKMDMDGVGLFVRP